MDLIAVQRSVENTENLVFVGPETDTDLLPGENFAELLPSLSPTRILISTTVDEMGEMDQDLDTECLKWELPFGYTGAAVHQACRERYGSNSSDPNRYISAEAMHAMSFLVGLVNKKKGGQTYVASFRLENHTTHADDLLYFFGCAYFGAMQWGFNKS